MKLYAQSHEFKLVRTLCDSPIDERWRFSILGKLSENHFHLESTRAALSRIKSLVRESQELPSWEDLLSDPVLSEDFRETLKDERPKRYTSRRRLNGSYGILEKYRRIRSLYFACKDTITELSDESIDLDEVVSGHAEALSTVHMAMGGLEEHTLTMGEGKKDVEKFAKQVLDAPSEVLLKTGFAKYDKINGGLPSSGVMIAAATTSGGKSVASMNLIYQMYMLNDIDVCRVSLEMMKEQELKRFMSRISGVPFWKIKHNKLSPRERTKILKSIRSFNSNPHHVDPWIGKRKFKRKGKFTTVTPAEGMTMESLLNMLKPYGYKVIVIDYVGLLAGMSGDRQWQALQDAVYLAKNFTKATGSLVIILAQLSAEDKLRYSQGMKEHADVMWQWNYSNPEVRATKQLPIEVSKARDGELMEMALDENFECMRVTSAKDDSDGSNPTGGADRGESIMEGDGSRAFA